jgi:multidrug efflux pump
VSAGETPPPLPGPAGRPSFTDVFIRHPVLALVVNLVLVLVGWRALVALPVQQYPKIESSSVLITTVYTGASAETVRGFLTTPIERVVSAISGIDTIESTSRAGVSLVTVRLKLNHDSTAALAEITARLQQVRSELPSEAEPPVVEVQRADRPYASFYLSFSSDERDVPALTDWLARTLQPQLATLSGVQRVGIEGGRPIAMRVWIDPDRLAALNLSPGDVSAALQRNNYLAAVGRTKGDEVQVNLLANTDLRSVEEFRDLIVADRGGAIVRLSDVARVELGAEEADLVAKIDSRAAVYLSVWPLAGTNEIDVAHRLRAEMDRLRPTLPKDIDMSLAYDATVFMENALTEITKTLSETVLIVGLVVFLFMGSLRTALVPLVAMPVSLIGAAIVMLAFGFSLNLLTMLAIVLSVGLVVDDAIVVVENVERHVREGRTRVDAALIGARELLGPILAMTVTLAAVYAPIGFQGGLTGTLFLEFAITLAAAVVVSGIVAVTLSPVMSSRFVHAHGAEGRLTRLVNRGFEAVRRRYARLLDGALELRWAIVAGSLAILAGAWPLYSHSRQELAPVEDQGHISLFLEASPDSTLEASDRQSQEVARAITAFPETDFMWSLTAGWGGFGGMVTKDWRERSRSTEELYGEVFAAVSQVPGLRVFPRLDPPLPNAGQYDVELVLQGDADEAQMLETTAAIVNAGWQSGKFLYVDTDLKVDLPQAHVVIDRERLADLGLDLAGVGQELGTLLGGAYVNRFNWFDRSYKVIPQIGDERRATVGPLLDLKVRTPGGDLVPVSTFTRIETSTAPRTLNRFQQRNAVRVFGGVRPGVTKEEGLTVLESAALAAAGPAITLDHAGESRQIRREGSALTVTLGFAVVLIYLVLAAQFRSFRDPLIVLLGSVPLAISGALVFTFLDLTTINIYSQVGLITLVGLIAKNGILIVQFANALRDEGLPFDRALREAAITRLRPVLMTSAATIFGHFPLVLVSGPGAEARNSIGIVLVTGMTVGTIFTLFVVPVFYSLIASRRRPDTVHAEPAALPLRLPGAPAVAGALLAALLLLPGCTTVGRDHVAPETAVPAAWRAQPGSAFAPRPAELASWWRRLDDPVLDALVERAATASLDVRESLERVREARALRGEAAADRFPTVDAGASYERRGESENTPLGGFVPDSDLFAAGFDASWELDLWGRVRRAVEAADADLAASIEDARDIGVIVAAEVARTYVDLRAFQARVEIARTNVTLQEETLELVNARYESGLVSERDVAQAATNVAITRSRVPSLERGVRDTEHRLAVLLGLPPGALADELEPARPVPVPPAQIAVGVPADLLRRRADVRRAERVLAAEIARIGVAEGELYPRFTLDGRLGFEAEEAGQLFERSSNVFGLGPSMRWNVFDGGRLRERVAAQDARAGQALVRWERAVLGALEETEAAMTAYVTGQARRGELLDAAIQARRAVELAQAQYGEGLSDFQPVVNSERVVADLEDQLAASDADIATSLVALYKALGGGWEHAPREQDPAAGTR